MSKWKGNLVTTTVKGQHVYRQKIRLGDSKTAPSPTLNTGQSRRRNQERLQVQSSASKSLNMDINSWHRHTARSIETRKQDNIMAGSLLTPVQWAFPNPFPRAGDMTAGIVTDTLCDSEKSEDDETESIDNLTKEMKRLSLLPTKSVTFNLPESNLDTPPCESDDASDQSDDTEEPTSQNDEVDARLAHTAWLRKTSENVYMSNRKAMSLKAYVHAAHRRTETPALLDSGATENFMSLTYAKWLKLSFKRLSHERPLYNVDGTTNKTGLLKYYVDLQVQTGTKWTNMRFFLTDMGDHKVILGYPWFTANQPKIDWARGWIDTTQLPLILRDAKAEKPRFNPSPPEQSESM